MTVTHNNITPASQTKNIDTAVNPKGILKKDDFLHLLLTELQYQDPTDPMDSDKILTQTSQLATLEAADNTNKSLETLSKTLTKTSAMSIVSSIGKMASLGKDTILLDEENPATFELYFQTPVQSGSVQISDINGNPIRQLDISDLSSGTHTFTWDGTNEAGERVEAGSYTVSATYEDAEGNSYKSLYGTYPIESVRFEEGEAKLKLGNHYYTLDQLKEVF